MLCGSATKRELVFRPLQRRAEYASDGNTPEQTHVQIAGLPRDMLTWRSLATVQRLGAPAKAKKKI